MSEQELNPAGLDALRDRFAAQSRKAQAYYTVMHAIRGVLGGDDAANAWMNAPLAAFGRQAPARLISEGRAEEVLQHIGTLKKPG